VHCGAHAGMRICVQHGAVTVVQCGAVSCNVEQCVIAWCSGKPAKTMSKIEFFDG